MEEEDIKQRIKQFSILMGITFLIPFVGLIFAFIVQIKLKEIDYQLTINEDLGVDLHQKRKNLKVFLILAFISTPFVLFYNYLANFFYNVAVLIWTWLT